MLLAVEKHQSDCVRVLAQLGADINLATKVFKMTPLILAAERGYCDIVQILLNNKALLNQKDMRGEYVVLSGSSFNRWCGILRHGTNFSTYVVNEWCWVKFRFEFFFYKCNVLFAGFTALHAAVLSSVVKTVELLLAAGADPNILDDDGQYIVQKSLQYLNKNVGNCSHQVKHPLDFSWIKLRLSDVLFPRSHSHVKMGFQLRY